MNTPETPRFKSTAVKLVSYFQRNTSSTYIPSIDGLRFLAIALVVFYHSGGYVAESLYSAKGHLDSACYKDCIYQWSSVGFFGVQIFFLISGFILSIPFAKCYLGSGKEENTSRISLRSYYLRRITRLEPPYFLNICILALLAIWLKGDAMWEVTQHAFFSLLYLHRAVYGSSSSINAVAWSLEIEVQFYLLFPLFAQLFRIRAFLLRRMIFIAIIVLFVLLQEFFVKPLWHGQSILNQLHFFFAGILLADFAVLDLNRKSLHWLFDFFGVVSWAALWLILMIFVTPDTYSHGFACHFCTVTILFISVYCTLRGSLFSRLLNFAPIYLIGGACYTIYLWHYFAISLCGRLLGRFSFGVLGIDILLCFVFGSIATIVICTPLFLLVEKPCMNRNWPRQFLCLFGRRAVSASRS